MAIPARIVASTLALGLLAAVGYYIHSADAAQGAGALAQAPMNIQANIKPAFIMAVDDSGSMTFQTMFPGGDGGACWDYDRQSFFDGKGALGVTGYCGFNYVMVGPQSGGRYLLPPFDVYGFSRSPDFNPSYFDPTQTYTPWVKSDLSLFSPASTSSTLIDPRGTASVNLFADRRETVEKFAIFPGMVIPKGTEYRTGDNWVTASNNITWTNNAREIFFKYRPGVFFKRYTSDADALPSADYVASDRVRVQNACGPGCDMWRYTPSTTAARQNFANWFSFYGNRNRAMVAGLTRAMEDVRDMRVGYFTINSRTATKDGYANVTMRDLTVPADKTALYDSMLTLPAAGGTPNRWAVDHIGKQFMRTGSGAPILNQCQRNTGMLFTDGYSNDDGPVAPAVTGLGVPFDPTPENSLAAIATRYYQTNLRPDLPAGKVRVPEACDTLPLNSIERKKLDCNTNPHMNFFGVTLGARGNLYNPDVKQDPYTDPKIYGQWPGRENDEPSTVDDIWHAAINTRGEYINARSPLDITEAMRRVLSSAGRGATPSGSMGLTGARIGAGSFTVTPSYNVTKESTDWSSTLLAEKVESSPITGAVTRTKLWEATDAGRIPEASARKIFVAKTTSGVVPQRLTFTAANVSFDELCVDSLKRCTKSGTKDGMVGTTSRLNTTIGDAIAYLRGDTSKEVRNLGGRFRDRSTRLGDIVNSTPVVSSPIIDFGYRSLRTVSGGTSSYPFSASYGAYLEARKNTAPVVFAGANDGMLHAFDGSTGNELFGFVPATALGHMGNLLFPYNPLDLQNQVFSHTYYVDGPVTVSDAFYSGSWRSVLVGTAGAGGRGVFGLDVTNPSSFGTTDILWEINDKVSTASIKDNIGHVLGKPVIVPVVDAAGTASWKAIFGNGYNSINQDAVLFVVDIASGAVTTIKAEEASRASIGNGLGNVVVLDRFIGTGTGSGRDGFADTVYAADQNGAIWKFDLRNNTVPTSPLFVATEHGTGERQPILGGLEVATGPSGGVMLFFGTGSFSFDGDKTDTQLQSFYGVLDRGASVTRAQLTRQELTANAAGDRFLTSNTMSGQGWFVDLGVKSGTSYVKAGERFVGYPRVENGIVFFTTYAPNSTADCSGDGSNRLYGVGALSGAGMMQEVRIGTADGETVGSGRNGLPLSIGGSAPVKDVSIMSVPRLDPLPASASPAEQAAALAARCSMVVQVAGAPTMYLPRPCGRQSWRQVR